MGSIPPAASIEYPQREIVAVINGSGLVPDNSDLSQLARGIQNGGMNYQPAGGTPNSISITLTPAPLAYYTGMMVVIRTTSTPTDQTQLDVNALGGKPIVGVDSKPISVGAWDADYMLVLVYDDTGGGKWVLVSQSALVIGGVTKLTAPRNYYVNVNTGSDTNDGATPATPFRTIQKGVTTVGLLDLNGYTAAVNVADGVYSESVQLSTVSQNGTAVLNGNDTNWANVNINPAAASSIITAQAGSNWIIHGFKVNGVAAPGDAGNGIWVTASGRSVQYYNMEFGACPGSHITISRGSIVNLGAVQISGGASSHILVDGGVFATDAAHPLTIVGTPVFSVAFIWCANAGTTYYIFSPLVGNSSGPKYLASFNGVINSEGGGINYYPGSAAGSTSAGGQYG